MMGERKYFGTDGIRGRANVSPMTAEVALRVGLAAGKLFMSGDDRRHLVVIGKDTRLSGYMIEPALVAGFASVGMDVLTFGPLPTPGVAMMTRSMRADLGMPWGKILTFSCASTLPCASSAACAQCICGTHDREPMRRRAERSRQRSYSGSPDDTVGVIRQPFCTPRWP